MTESNLHNHNPKSQTSDLRALLNAAETAAYRAGEMIQESWMEPGERQDKGFRDWVTEADFASQRIITQYLRERFPEHGFRTEEDNPELPITGRTLWVIDPIDGTSNLSRQQPNFCITLAAVNTAAAAHHQPSEARAPDAAAPDHVEGAHEAAVLAGVVYDPIRDEMFSASAGGGSTLNGAPLQVSTVTELEDALVALDWAHEHHRREICVEMVGRFIHQVHTARAIGSAALALAWVAAGRLDAYLNLGLHPWDMAAGALLIREAGGQLTDWQDRPWLPIEPIEEILASNGQIHQALRRLVAVEYTVAAPHSD
ncbi:MAG: inositol monophosphatase family protein [Candidatus Promineifilaceae bacterium]|nr:inositol monophosphatase family protein [Candidatus Promineifilaceae bacterium]